MKPSLLALLNRIHEHRQSASSFWGAPLRPATPEEIAALAAQANHIEGQLFVTQDFSPQNIYGNRFCGRVVLGRFDRGGVWFSTLEDSEIAPGAKVDRCPLLRRTLCEGQVVASAVDCPRRTRFGLGRQLKAGVETGERWIPVTEALTLELALAQANFLPAWAEAQQYGEQIEADFSYLGPQSSLFQVNLAEGVLFVGPVEAKGCAQLKDSCFYSADERPILLGAGVIADTCFFQAGTVLASQAFVKNSVFLEASGAEEFARVHESLIGPNTSIAGGEVHASLLGPFIGLHHQSLLIAAWWPGGRGNVGYGANVGSNHTSRSPDQEVRPGEGMFFGLDCAVKFPADWSQAPYTILATGVVTDPQKYTFPFSLIVENTLPGTPQGYNRAIPAWVLRENIYMLLRNEKKFLRRNKARALATDLRLWRPDLVERLWISGESLEKITGKSVYTPLELPGLGRNLLSEKDRLLALDAYKKYSLYGALRLYVDSFLGLGLVDPIWVEDFLERLSWGHSTKKARFDALLALEEEILANALRSRQKDDQKGTEVFSDYAQVHAPADKDPFIEEKRQDLHSLRQNLAQLGV
ncbi:MAG: DUF4954 family protein [Spirochaetales bacterium]|nr:DUF4954 family protein [Spirochaetales bacterium]